MGVGSSYNQGGLSYLAIGRETAYGTYVTGTSFFNFMSASMKAMKGTKILEEIQTSRTNSNYIQEGKVIEGEVEGIFNPRNLACNHFLHNAFGGGPVTSATATGDTAGAVSFTHQVDIANFAATYSSLSMNFRKGETTTGEIFEYTGLRVNELTLKAELNEPLIATFALIGKDVTLSSNDIASKADTTTSVQTPLSFVNGRLSVETTVAALTSTSYWSIQAVELGINNNFNPDAGRRLGSDVLETLPQGMAQFTFNCTIRFDTSTAFDAMMAGTRLAAQLEFQGPTLSGSVLREGIKFTLPFVLINDAGDPEVGSPGDPLTSEVSFAVLRDPTTSGYALRALVLNATANYT